MHFDLLEEFDLALNIPVCNLPPFLSNKDLCMLRHPSASLELLFCCSIDPSFSNLLRYGARCLPMSVSISADAPEGKISPAFKEILALNTQS